MPKRTPCPVKSKQVSRDLSLELRTFVMPRSLPKVTCLWVTLVLEDLSSSSKY
jgi:hypothetical protein